VWHDGGRSPAGGAAATSLPGVSSWQRGSSGWQLQLANSGLGGQLVQMTTCCMRNMAALVVSVSRQTKAPRNGPVRCARTAWCPARLLAASCCCPSARVKALSWLVLSQTTVSVVGVVHDRASIRLRDLIADRLHGLCWLALSRHHTQVNRDWPGRSPDMSKVYMQTSSRTDEVLSALTDCWPCRYLPVLLHLNTACPDLCPTAVATTHNRRSTEPV
jgi:hypothetical protein